jgi:uncharacterized membrane protein (GlpM family)
MPVEILVLKLVVTPLLVAVATLVARRWGPGVGGWLAGFPLTSAPVSVFLALEQGPDFAAGAAVGTLLGLTALGAFCLAYGRAARRVGWAGSAAAGLGVFGACLAVLSAAPASLLAAFALVCVTLALVAALLPATTTGVSRVKPATWDLPFRMAVATAVVLLLTAAARHLGPTISGLLSPVPVFLLVMAIFAQRSQGPDASVRVLRGGVVGSFAFAVFFLVVGALLGRVGIGATYALAALGALVVNGATLGVGRRLFR